VIQKRALQRIIGSGLAFSFLVGCVTSTAVPPSLLPTPTPVPPPATSTFTPIPPATPGLAPATPSPMPTAREYMLALSEAIGPRVAGTPNEAKAAQYIEAAFKQIGYVTFTQPFTFTTTADPARTLSSANVVAVKTGQSAREIIVGAHYDSVDAGSRGADDNASGVAVMLKVASRIREAQTPYTVRFVAFGAEEVGDKGSGYYVSHMGAADVRNTLTMIDLDSLVAGDIAYVYGDASGKGITRDSVLEMAKNEGYDLRTQMGENPDYPAGTTGPWSDHAPFNSIGIPYVYFEATNWGLGKKDGWTQVNEELGDKGEIWHTPYDTLQYIDTTFPGRIDQHLKLFVAVLYNTLTPIQIVRLDSH